MYITQKKRLKFNNKEYELILKLCRLSKNLYNVTLYETRQFYIRNDSFLVYAKAYHIVKENENYKQMPKQTAQQTMKVIERNMRSFFGLLRERKKGNYNRQVGLPRYLQKDGYFDLIFQKDQFKIIDNKVRLSLGNYFSKRFNSKYLYVPLSKNIIGKQIKEVRINPKANGKRLYVEYIYKIESEKPELNSNEYLSIDLGLDNFATIVSTTTNEPPIILYGRGLKSFNRWWNKEKSRLDSIYENNKVKTGRKMLTLFDRRFGYINNIMNQYVNFIIKYCIKNKIGNIVIGELQNIKQEQNHGKVNNQNFQTIPYGIFKRKLKGKCERYGIIYIETDEAYTSKCDALSFEPIKKHEKYSGKRIHRGLFKSSIGKVINADVNGALNILRKVSGDSVARRIIGSGFVYNPKRIYV